MSAEARGAQLPSPATAEPEAREADVAAARRLYRSRSDRMFAGVCGGIAETYGSDPTAVRLLTAVIGIVTGIIPMLIVYLVAAVVIPERTSDDLPTAVQVIGAHFDEKTLFRVAFALERALGPSVADGHVA